MVGVCEQRIPDKLNQLVDGDVWKHFDGKEMPFFSFEI